MASMAQDDVRQGVNVAPAYLFGMAAPEAADSPVGFKAPGGALEVEEHRGEAGECREALSGERPMQEQSLHVLRGAALGESAKSFALPDDHPVSIMRDVARALYERLDEFVESNVSRPSQGFGFSIRNVAPVRTESLVGELSGAIRVLTEVITVPAVDPLIVRAHDIAKDLKVGLQMFRQTLADPSVQNGVPENMVPSLVESTIVFQRGMSDYMNDLTSLSYGVQVSRSA